MQKLNEKQTGNRPIIDQNNEGVPSLRNQNFIESSRFSINYTGCVVIRRSGALIDQDKRELDFEIPNQAGSESGAVIIEAISRKGKIFNSPHLVPCTREEIKKIKGKLLIRIRNILFIDAMLFVKCDEQYYHLAKKQGPLYLYVDPSEYQSVYRQLTNKKSVS